MSRAEEPESPRGERVRCGEGSPERVEVQLTDRQLWELAAGERVLVDADPTGGSAERVEITAPGFEAPDDDA
ncbi:MAG: hypothetical protein ABEJ28_11955 [Salinigranum sp.]